MISAARTTNRRNGFTLIEIVMVLAIAAVVVGGAVGMMVYSSDERALRDGSGEIELLAKRARIISIRQQTPYALEFRPGVVRLLPLAEAGVIERRMGSGRSIGGAAVEMEEDSQSRVRDEVFIDPALSLHVRRWNSEAWLPTSENLVHVWRFDPDGLCEPVSVRLTTTSGSWNVDHYHPLTAAIRDSEMEAR